MTQWWLDTRMLDAGDARRLGDPPPAVYDISARRADLVGNLDAAADRLGVDVRDLVALRRRIGIAPTHRRPGPLARIAARIIRKR